MSEQQEKVLLKRDKQMYRKMEMDDLLYVTYPPQPVFGVFALSDEMSGLDRERVEPYSTKE